MNMYAGVEVYTHAFLIFTLNRNEWVSFKHQQVYQWGQTWLTGGRIYPTPISKLQIMETYATCWESNPESWPVSIHYTKLSRPYVQ
jgi:hypothetical protein